jgi:microcystin-dependent protein
MGARKGTQWAALSVGIILPFAGTTAPNGWLLCYGQEINRADYNALFDVIGTTYGTGDGTTTFNLPDLRGRVPAGLDNMGGVAASRLTNAGTGNPGLDATVLGGVGGSDRHILTTQQLANHTHDVKYDQTQQGAGSLVNTLAVGGAGTQASENGGGGQAHPNVQPTMCLNYLIKA